ncbi:hypothetical protein AB0F20_29745 [Streptomyces goshikiensis]|uniref:hypothetical protein n=1 Tax=Streptomyces goshikiensis TaxID=1942 RepID=UPI00340873EB
MKPCPPGDPLLLTTPTGTRITAFAEHDWTLGLTLYRVTETGGWITISPSRGEVDELLVTYGQPEGYTLDHVGTTWTHRPVFNGQEVRGSATINISTMERYLTEPGWDEADTWQYWLTRPRRALPLTTGSDPWEQGRVTPRAHQRAASTVAALVRHYAGQPERADLRQALAYTHAPRDIEDLEGQRQTAFNRIRDHARTARDLTERIARARRIQPAPQQRGAPTRTPTTERTIDAHSPNSRPVPGPGAPPSRRPPPPLRTPGRRQPCTRQAPRGDACPYPQVHRPRARCGRERAPVNGRHTPWDPPPTLSLSNLEGMTALGHAHGPTHAPWTGRGENRTRYSIHALDADRDRLLVSISSIVLAGGDIEYPHPQRGITGWAKARNFELILLCHLRTEGPFAGYQ